MADDTHLPTVVWDVSQMLGSVHRDADDTPVAIDVYPDVPELLERLHRRARMVPSLDAGTAFDAGTRARSLSRLPALLHAAKLAPYFDLDAAPPAMTATSPAATRASRQRPRHVLASANRSRRAAAVRAGWGVAPHRDLIEEVLAGERLFYARLSRPPRAGSIDALIRGLAVVPVYRPTSEPNTLHAIVSRRTALRLQRNGGSIVVEPFSGPRDPEQGAPADTELYLVRDCLDPSQESSVFFDRVKERARLHWRADHSLILALGEEHDIADLHPPRASHGHTTFLPPTRDLLRGEPPARAARPRPAAPRFAATLPKDVADIVVATLTPQLVETHLAGWTGKALLPKSAPPRRVATRLTGTADNRRVVNALVGVLSDVLRVPATKEEIFSHGYFNVEGRLAGTNGSEIVVVGAHLDSIALDGPSAPGTDDDASGMAAVLAIATTMRALADQLGKPRRGIRFVLFNGEEQGFVGSNSYAVKFAGSKSPVRPVAMIQLDMVGVPSTLKPPSYELHPPGPEDYTGSLSEPSRRRSVAIADLIAQLATAPKNPLENTLKIDVLGAAKDPMATRSDHCSFLKFDMPACLVTENAFNDPVNKDPAFARRYHRTADRDADTGYIAMIGRAVAAAVWIIANEPPSSTTTTHGGLRTMHDDQEENQLADEGLVAADAGGPKRILELVADFMDQSGVRCPILKNHETGLRDYGVSDAARIALGSMDLAQIVPVLLSEELGLDVADMEQLVSDLEKKRNEVRGQQGDDDESPTPGFRALAAAAGAYSASGVHIFEVSRVNGGDIVAGEETWIQLRGNGYEHGGTLPDIRFVHFSNDEEGDVVEKRAATVACDEDLNERATVKVTLPSTGIWWAHIRNPGGDWEVDHQDRNRFVVV